MKKILSILSMMLVALVVASCSQNSPEGVVKNYYTLIGEGKYDEAVELLHFKKEKTAEEKQQFADMMREKAANDLDKRGGITSIDITKVEMAEDGKSANVSAKITYGNGDDKIQDNKVVNVDGDWKVDSGK